jgi:hypothetical protein
VYLKDELKNNDLLIACKMSPPILIDSRKLAREKQIIKVFLNINFILFIILGEKYFLIHRNF